MIAVGIGCRRDASAAAIRAAVEHVLAKASLTLGDVYGLFTADFKTEQTALREAAGALGTSITFLPLAALKQHANDVHTHSPHVLERWGVPSVAETAALAGAQSIGTEKVRLLGPRLVHEGVTCALAAEE